jgi:putative membrane protein
MNKFILAPAAALLMSSVAFAQTPTAPAPAAPPAAQPAPVAPPVSQPAAPNAAPMDTTPSTTGTVQEVPPLRGANSFTEAQAKSRFEADGFSGITGLAKDADGIWRGTGSKDGKTMTVMLDFKGNIVAR